jgi:hypothetical protein
MTQTQLNAASAQKAPDAVVLRQATAWASGTPRWWQEPLTCVDELARRGDG